MDDKEAHAPDGVERLQHFRMRHNPVNAQRSQHQKPGHHHRPEQDADPRRTVALKHKQGHQYDQRNGHHPTLEAIERQLHAFYRREHRDGRGDHAVAIKQRCTDQTEDYQHAAQPGIRQGRPPRQRGQRHDAAFTLVIGAQDEQHVFKRDDPDQRPENQRQNTQHTVMVERYPICSREHLLKGVQRTGTNITINHPDGRDQQAQRFCRIMPSICLTHCLTHLPLLQQDLGSKNTMLCLSERRFYRYQLTPLMRSGVTPRSIAQHSS